MKETVLIGQASPEQLAAWKAQFPLGIYQVRVNDHVGYFKMPTFDETNCAMGKYELDKPLNYSREIAEMTKIGGSDELLKNDTYLIATIQIVKRKVESLEAELLDL